MQASDYKRIFEDRHTWIRQFSEPEAPNGWYWQLGYTTLWSGPHTHEQEAIQAVLDYLLVNTSIGVKVQQLVMRQQQTQGTPIEQLRPDRFDCAAAAHQYVDQRLEQLMRHQEGEHTG